MKGGLKWNIELNSGKFNIPCERPGCNNRATDRHCCYPETQANIKVYGDLIFQDFNIRHVCNADNGSHANIQEFIWNEIEFRAAAFDAGFDNLPMSKSMRFKKF